MIDYNKNVAKRIFDIVFSLIILITMSPVVALLILIYLVEMMLRSEFRGNIFYHEIRISANKKYKHYKFRTCKIKIYINLIKNNRELCSAQIESNHKNFSFTGKILKKIYLDKFPQLYNVLKGNISLVGPRPKPVSEYKQCLIQGNLAKKILKAGLTGSFQSYKGHWNGKDDVQYDNEYLKFLKKNNAKLILWNDLKILFRSAKVILEHKGI